MPKFQVNERENFSSNWSIPRDDGANGTFTSEEDALKAARKYMTGVNVENALVSDAKEDAAELFMIDKEGRVFLGVLDGKDWYMQYKKDIYDKKDRNNVLHKKGEVVKDRTYPGLDGKGEVCVRQVPKS